MLAIPEQRSAAISRMLWTSVLTISLGFWLWSAWIVVAAGFLGAVLNCEGFGECDSGSPSWLQPWTWGNYDVYPESLFIGLAGLAAASAFVVLVLVARRRVPAAASLLVSLVLLSYPYFAGLTTEGRATFWFGPLLGLAALYTMRTGLHRDDVG